MTDQDRVILERIAVALEKIANKPVVITNGYVWDEQIKNWTHPDEYAERRSS